MAISALSVFLSEKHIFIQGIGVFFVLMAAAWAQAYFKPYLKNSMNVIETSGLAVATITMFLPLWAMFDNARSKEIITIIVFLANTVFLSYMFYRLFKAYKTYDCIKRICIMCIGRPSG